MSDGDGAAKFSLDSHYLAVYGSLGLYAVMAVAALICTLYALYIKEYRNYTLMLLLVGILVFGVMSEVMYTLFDIDGGAAAALLSGI